MVRFRIPVVVSMRGPKREWFRSGHMPERPVHVTVIRRGASNARSPFPKPGVRLTCRFRRYLRGSPPSATWRSCNGTVSSSARGRGTTLRSDGVSFTTLHHQASPPVGPQPLGCKCFATAEIERRLTSRLHRQLRDGPQRPSRRVGTRPRLLPASRPGCTPRS
jgi:hypothetical protein